MYLVYLNKQWVFIIFQIVKTIQRLFNALCCGLDLMEIMVLNSVKTPEYLYLYIISICISTSKYVC